MQTLDVRICKRSSCLSSTGNTLTTYPSAEYSNFVESFCHTFVFLFSKGETPGTVASPLIAFCHTGMEMFTIAKQEILKQDF